MISFSIFLSFLQSSNTRSQKGEKEKNPLPPPPPPSDGETLDEHTVNDSSIMDRTRRLRQARNEAKKKARAQQGAEEEAAELDQLVEDAREKLEATKAAKRRAAESRRILAELQAEMVSDQDGVTNFPEGETDNSRFVTKDDFNSLVADSLKSVVSYFLVKFNLLLLTTVFLLPCYGGKTINMVFIFSFNEI